MVKSLGIFWDLENVQIPRRSSARDMVQLVRACVVTADVEERIFEAFLDVTKISQVIALDLERAGVKMVHIPTGSKNSADLKIIQAVNDFVRIYGESTIVLLTSDENFLPLAHSLRRIPNVKSVLIHAKQVNPALKESFDKSFEWPSLESGVGNKQESSRTIFLDEYSELAAKSNGKTQLKTSRGNLIGQDLLTDPKRLNIDYEQPSLVSDSTTKWECIRCNRCFLSEKALRQHQIATAHLDPVEYLPPVASVTPLDEEAQAPQTMAGERNSFMCLGCGSEFGSENALEQHQDATGHINWFTCLCCNRDFDTERALQMHQISTGHDELFKREGGNSDFDSEQVIEQNQDAKDIINWFTCLRCNRDFDSEKDLQMHQISTGHDNLCKRVSGNSDFDFEQVVEQNQDAPKDNVNRFACLRCNRDFDSERALQMHQISTGHDNLFMRVSGNSDFDSVQVFEQNQDAKGHANSFSCMRCNRDFHSKKALEQHGAATGHSNALLCLFCCRAFRSEKALEQHQTATRHVNSALCLSCLRGFDSENSLYQHQVATGHSNRIV